MLVEAKEESTKEAFDDIWFCHQGIVLLASVLRSPFLALGFGPLFLHSSIHVISVSSFAPRMPMTLQS
jgi:hypothetical protein